MVLYKRKHVEYNRHAPTLQYAPNAELWEIPQTGELFETYETYLKRRDFYYQKQFSCEITGHTGLTFFDALESENQGNRELDSSFPDPLRGPVLKKVQHSVISRLEYLLAWVYEEFKHDFYPKERVLAKTREDEKLEGVVRDKITFPSRYFPNGQLERREVSQYVIAFDEDPKHPNNPRESVFEGTQLVRDRRHFSKHILRSFLKNSLTKETWHGAPWQVKEKLAIQYRLPTEVPLHLQYDARMAEKKALALQKKAQEAEGSPTFFNFLAAKQRPLEVRPKGKGKGRGSGLGLENGTVLVNGNVHYQQTIPQMLVGRNGNFPHPMSPSGEVFVNGHIPPTMHPQLGPVIVRDGVVYQVRPEMPPPQPTVKYPTEDLDVPPRRIDIQRPSLRFYAEELPVEAQKSDEAPQNGLKMKSMGPLLDIWNTLNVHCEVYVLDSFTLDDFAEAMRFQTEDVECELVNEVFCSVLKQIVNEDGELQVDLPDMEEEDEDEEESEEESSAEPDPEPEPPRRRTRSSFVKEEVQQRSPSPELKKVHQAAEVIADANWMDMLKAREFKNGGWQIVLVGLLHQLSMDERLRDRCNDLLAHIVPLDQDATTETVVDQFKYMDVNMRLEALNIIVKLTVTTKAIRNHLENMANEMTTIRKNRIEQQRMKKDLNDEIHQLDEQRKQLVAVIGGPDMAPETNGDEDTTQSLPDTNGDVGTSENSDDDEAPRVLRRGADRSSERKRKREEDAARKLKKQKAAATKLTKEEMQLKKITQQIEGKREEIKDCEDTIAELTDDLRETDCQRTKCLGRDRFCNRYYWFERNGMPYAGVPHTSTAHYGYANGRIWVQGPDQMEREGFLDLPDGEQAQYHEAHGVTVKERKLQEEGSTHLYDANEWAYYDDPGAVDQLIAWLDDRGNREKALRKELQQRREVIVECMDKLRIHLDEAEAKKAAAEEEGITTTRVSTRTKTYVDLENTQWRCLAWHNSLAVEQFGLIHSEGLKPKRKKGVTEKKEKVPLTKGGKVATKGKR